MQVDKTFLAWANLDYVGFIALVFMLAAGMVGPMLSPKLDKKKVS